MADAPPPQFSPAPFAAEQLLHKDDVTIHLRSEADSATVAPGCLPPDQAFVEYRKGLNEKLDTKSKPVFSIARELNFFQRGGQFKARGLACLCERGQAVSVTLRSIKKCDQNGPDFIRDIEGPPRALESEFQPKGDYNKPPAWFSIRDHCNALGDLIIGPNSHPVGLVVVCGSTNSAKSLIARGLIHGLLKRKVEERWKKTAPPNLPFLEMSAKIVAAKERLAKLEAGGTTSGDEWESAKSAIGRAEKDREKAIKALNAQNPAGRRPHLVTFEDPIEDFFIEPTPDASATELAARWGIDYTPRERGTDVRDLQQGFADALRQTPTAYFIGEVREPSDWKAVLGFAATGHLVVTTAHADSMLEMMMKILSSVNADTPAKRRLYAEKIRAVVHMRPFETRRIAGLSAEQAKRGLLLPSLWRKTEKGLSGLTGNGYGSIVPLGSIPAKDADSESCFGYHALFEKLLAYRDDPNAPLNDWVETRLARAARVVDL